MKIIHCADMHLDSALGTHFSATQAKMRNAELCATFGRLVSYAVAEQVEAVLIAGDLFDSGQVSARTVDFVLETIRSAGNVTFFYLRGNHDGNRDPFDGWEKPHNLKCFGSEWASYRCGDVVITGKELEWEKWDAFYDGLDLACDAVNIAMLHGQISTQPGAERINLPKLRGRNIDYLALGHIHAYQSEKLDDRGVFCYCGCLEGRGFDECGEKGFVLLDVREHGIRHTFIPFASRTLHEIDVDITDAETVTELLSRMERASAAVSADDLVKFVLRGAYTLQTQKDLIFLQKMLSPKFYFVKVKDESRLKIDRGSYEFDASLKGEFIRLVLSSNRADEEKERIISCGIRALMGEEVAL